MIAVEIAIIIKRLFVVSMGRPLESRIVDSIGILLKCVASLLFTFYYVSSSIIERTDMVDTIVRYV